MVHVAMNVDVRHTLLVVGYHVGTVVRKHKNTLGEIILFFVGFTSVDLVLFESNC